jgi:hypothetical protein
MSFLSVGSIQRARRLPPQGLQVKLGQMQGGPHMNLPEKWK